MDDIGTMLRRMFQDLMKKQLLFFFSFFFQRKIILEEVWEEYTLSDLSFCLETSAVLGLELDLAFSEEQLLYT